MNVALIPVRGGSKSIPLKNIKPICGKPLIYWTLKAACMCEAIDIVYVATDSESIMQTVNSFNFSKVVVIKRSAESATDTASTEFVMLEFAENYQFDNIILIQATSPLLQSYDLKRGFDEFLLTDTDSVLSVVRQKRFIWQQDDKGYARSTNYNVFHRPRRQEFDGFLVENGAFYITSRNELLRTRNRVSGRIRVIEMCEDSYYEIDEPSDWVILEALMRRKGISENKLVSEIKMFLTDCDGCLTDGGMYYSENGDELKKFNTRDGMGFALLKERGVITGIITGEDTKLTQRRAEKLKMDIYVSGCKDKLSIIKELCLKYSIGLENVAYVGDDINDLDTIKAVGFGCCPSDAVTSIKDVADFVTSTKGGEGAIREVINKIVEG